MNESKCTESVPADMNENNFKPKFHFSCPKGWMNDPNGFSFFNGEFHLYYQHYPFDTKWGPMHWGHATSKDLLHWTDQPIALYPDSPCDNQGCFSGTALTENDRQILIYTGVTKNPANTEQNIQQQCIAINDGKTFSKLEQNPVIKSSDVKTDFRITDFRDPKIFKEQNTYYCASVIMKQDGNGAIALFSSTDLLHWQFLNILAETNGEMGGMWECPDFFTLEGKDVIIVSPQSVKACDKKGFHDGNNSVYITGTYDKTTHKLIPDTRPENNFYAAEIDYGIDFYAPQTVLAPDGRRIMIAWLQAWESYITPKNHNWSGMMTMPRELVFKNNRLIQRPVREYEEMISKCETISGKIDGINTGLHNDKNTCHNISGTILMFDNASIPQCDFSVKFTLHNNGLNNSSASQGMPEPTKGTYTDPGKLLITVSDDNQCYVNFTLDVSKMTLTFDRSHSIDNGGAINNRSVKINPAADSDNQSSDTSKTIELRFIFDTYSCETFINGGETVFTNAYFLNKNVRRIKVESTLSCGLEYKLVKF